MIKPTARPATGLLAVACVAGVAAVPTNAATTVQVHPPEEDPRFGGLVSVTGDKRANDIAVWFNRKRGGFVVKDSTARITTQECFRRSRHKVRCKAEPSNHSVSVVGDSGGDRIRFRRSVRSDTYLDGNDGGDRIRGGAGSDRMLAGPGDDRLSGRSGSDFISGGRGDDVERGGPGGDLLGDPGDPGRDAFLGGRDRDQLRTRDGIVDRRIDCGRGRRDLAIVDRSERSRAQRCRRVLLSNPFVREAR